MKTTYIERGLSKVAIVFENDYKWREQETH